MTIESELVKHAYMIFDNITNQQTDKMKGPFFLMICSEVQHSDFIAQANIKAPVQCGKLPLPI